MLLDQLVFEKPSENIHRRRNWHRQTMLSTRQVILHRLVQTTILSSLFRLFDFDTVISGMCALTTREISLQPRIVFKKVHEQLSTGSMRDCVDRDWRRPRRDYLTVIKLGGGQVRFSCFLKYLPFPILVDK